MPGDVKGNMYLNIPMPLDVKGKMYVNIQMARTGLHAVVILAQAQVGSNFVCACCDPFILFAVMVDGQSGIALLPHASRLCHAVPDLQRLIGISSALLAAKA